MTAPDITRGGSGAGCFYLRLFFAATFKYYLHFTPPQTPGFDGVIFNTEAHPVRRE
jgi:hypothetical protein